MKLLEINHLKIKYTENYVVDDISFTVSEGQWLMIAGPNGAGKSTILNAISKGVLFEGDIFFKEQDIHSMNPSQLAKHIGILSQNHSTGYDFTVREVVGLGRYAYQSRIFRTGLANNEAAINAAISAAGLENLEYKSILHLSGGEVQRTFLAQLFAQDPDIMILDEPANHLDLVYQKQVFELIQNWLGQPGRAVISVVHDLSLAKAYGTHCLLLNHGRQAAYGCIDDVLTPKELNSVYQMDVYEWMKKMLSQWA